MAQCGLSAQVGHKNLLLAARELLIDLERTDLESVLATGDVPPNGSPARVPVPMPMFTKPSAEGGEGDEHKLIILQQVDQLRESLLASQQTCEQLSDENSQLSRDLRSLASQLKLERATSNALVKAGGDTDELGAKVGENGDTSGLTLASAASQILLLRREVKFLQRQWNSARVDQSSATTREQMQQLRDEAAEAKRAATAADAATSSAEAKCRLLLRELKAARAQARTQYARMLKRSAAQREVGSLKEQLGKANDAFTAQQQQLKQLKLRERLRRAADEEPRRAADDDDEAERGGYAVGLDAMKVEAEAAHAGLGLMILGNELTLLERAWMAERDAAAELVAIKANMSFQVAQVGDDNSTLQAEVTRLKARLAALQEEKELMQGSLNALNNDLAGASVQQQEAAAAASAAAVNELAKPPPPPPLLQQGSVGGTKGLKAVNKQMSDMKAKFKFGNKKPTMDTLPEPSQ